MTKHPSRKVVNFRHLLGCDTVANLQMVLIDQVVGEIIVTNLFLLCELEKNWINRLQTYGELNYYNNYILNLGSPHKPKVK